MKDSLDADKRAIETQSELLSLLDQIVDLATQVKDRLADGDEHE